jgi:hypothetical protein
MSVTLSDEVIQDDLALPLACAVAAANRRAREFGIDVGQSFLTITQDFTNGLHWRVTYGPKNAVGRRGGDLIVEIDAVDGTVTQVLHGQ